MFGKRDIEVDSDWMTAGAFAFLLVLSIVVFVWNLSRYVSGVFTVPSVWWSDYILSAGALFGVAAFRPFRALQVACGLLFLLTAVPIVVHWVQASGDLLQVVAKGLALLRVILDGVLLGYFIQWFRERVRFV